jgi:two-component system sensor histidine kinase KdpD
MPDTRPDPDLLLAQIQRQQAEQTLGKLKIFLGMAAGVGKTYAMLEAAQQRRAEGINIVVGYVETHHRPETDALLEGLEVIPPLRLEYRGVTLEEMDTDAIITRHPALVLVDELAHTNANGSRHVKRYQDVEELLAAGISVYTTVNVQHFESRADTAAQITGIVIHETVPDSILDLADQIELIDLSPDDLRKRLREGKVYTLDKAAAAERNFFRVGNLTALREMALRLAAEHVDTELQDYMQVKRIAGPWKSTERLLVAVSPSPFSARLIRWTRRIAYNLEAPWYALYVKPTRELSATENRELTKNLGLARSLGAEVSTTAGEEVAAALLHFARQHNVTQIVIGKPIQTPQAQWISMLQGGSLTDRLIRESGDIDVYVVTGDDENGTPISKRAVSRFPHLHSTHRSYLRAVLIIFAVTIVELVYAEWVGVRDAYLSIGLIELFCVLMIALYIGRVPALLAAVLSAFSWNFLFIEPRFTFTITRPHDALLFILYFLFAVTAGNITARLREKERQATYNAERNTALYDLTQALAKAGSLDDILRESTLQIERAFNAEVGVLMPAPYGLGRIPHPSSTLVITDSEYGVAVWVYENRKPAGKFTQTLNLATTAQYRPLQTNGETILGVIGIRLRQEAAMNFEQDQLLETFLKQIALVVERERLDEATEAAARLAESQRLYTTLLNSISHELRTPLVTVTGAASSLERVESRETQQTLVNDIQDAAHRLNDLVDNLLDMSRLDSGLLQLKLEWCAIDDVVGTAVQKVGKGLIHHPLTLHLPPELPLLKLDFVLMEQVIVNLLNNIKLYTPPGTRCAIRARADDRLLTLTVRDHGPGLPNEETLSRIFERFYRAPGASTGGTGLGLSICKGFVEAHGGTISADNAPDGGLRFTLTLPIQEHVPPVKEATL